MTFVFGKGVCARRVVTGVMEGVVRIFPLWEKEPEAPPKG